MTDVTTAGALAASDQLVGRIDTYVRGGMLPLWATRGWDRERGGCHERLRADHRPADIAYRRLTVGARQLFVFSRAAELDLLADARTVADRIFRYLVEHFRDEDHGGWFFTVGLTGEPLDRRKDLYAHDFVLLGLAHYAAIARDRQALGLLDHTREVIQRRFLLPAGWYAASAAPDWSVRNEALLQNPHMHLFEACLAAGRTTGDGTYWDDARTVVGLLRSRLRDPATGTISEFRDAHGEPDPEHGHVVEPGHHFEWCWLLHQAAQIFEPEQCRDDAGRLFDWALAHGIDRRHGGVLDQVGSDGRVIADSKRIWPLTEYVKARAARFLHGRRPSELDELITALTLLFDAYLLPDGGWRERLRRDLTCYDDELPATTCYHVMVALLEARAALTMQGDAASP
jgi:mannose/cellobiose epimerase-like protein (N-acyl-D-glucosamine 2-epimerase family)